MIFSCSKEDSIDDLGDHCSTAYASPDDAWKCFVSAHFSIKKTIFKKYYFDESFIQWGCEDIDLGYRLFQAGEVIYFVKECVVYNSSQGSRRTKQKFRTLSESLVQMYNKYRTEDLKLYCFERFYHMPIKYRGSAQLIFKNKDFEVRKSQTKIAINKNCQTLAVLGSDFQDVASTIENMIPLTKSIHFDASIIRTLKEPSLSDFRNIFHRLIKILRDKKINMKNITVKNWLDQQ